jgi:hypothetical protein
MVALGVAFMVIVAERDVKRTRREDDGQRLLTSPRISSHLCMPPCSERSVLRRERKAMAAKRRIPEMKKVT